MLPTAPTVIWKFNECDRGFFKYEHVHAYVQARQRRPALFFCVTKDFRRENQFLIWGRTVKSRTYCRHDSLYGHVPPCIRRECGTTR